MVYRKMLYDFHWTPPINHRNGQYVWIPWNISHYCYRLNTSSLLKLYTWRHFFLSMKVLTLLPTDDAKNNMMLWTWQYTLLNTKKTTLLIQMYQGIYLNFVMVHSDVHPSYGILDRNCASTRTLWVGYKNEK